MKLAPCRGIPVVFDPKFEGISDSRGVWPFKRIFVGPAFRAFPAREQAALLLHEVGHCKLFHVEKRIASLWRLLWRPSTLAALCVEQEFEADRYAAASGYGVELAQAFARVRAGHSLLHPPAAERIARLLGHG